jgi:hypothetical protein
MTTTNALILRLPTSQRLAVHNFSSIEGASFDAADYSRLKFGSDRVANDFGHQMADEFYARHHDILTSQPCVIIPAPSTTVKVAATILSHHMMNRLNSLLAQHNHAPVEWTMIHRNMTYNNNYADLPKEERKKLLAADSIFINRDFVAGKYLIFVDDCTITGTHEEKIEDFLREEGLLNDHAFVCFAKYDGDDPSIEMRLNHVTIKDARDLVMLAHEKNHHVTTRSLRLLLEHPEADFERLLDGAPEDFIEASYHAAIVKGYNTYPAYVCNFNHLARRMGMGMGRPFG